MDAFGPSRRPGHPCPQSKDVALGPHKTLGARCGVLAARDGAGKPEKIGALAPRKPEPRAEVVFGKCGAPSFHQHPVDPPKKNHPLYGFF